MPQQKDKRTGQTDSQTSPHSLPSWQHTADPWRAAGSAPPWTPAELSWVSPRWGQGQGAPHLALPRAECPARGRGCTPGCPEHLCPPAQHPKCCTPPKWGIPGWDSEPWRGQSTKQLGQKKRQSLVQVSLWAPATLSALPRHRIKNWGALGAAPPLSHTGKTPPLSQGCSPPVPPASSLPAGGAPQGAAAPPPCRQPPSLQQGSPARPSSPVSALSPALPPLSLQRGTGGDSSTFCISRESCRNQHPNIHPPCPGSL